ncbi:MAG: ribosomal-processing cysteine protease Prp [Synergistaceae bacterium]|jgi:uncharacterized protein YsxB (DUF464 family)|nr:ribosomal-processing cysteine protease Prp [Synergistaceae bacterium]
MLVVTALRDSRGIYSISAEGHADYADEGFDIVCASVSTLIQALGVGLEDVLELKGVKSFIDRKTRVMSYEWDGSVEEAQTIAWTILLSIKAVAESYPDYIEVREVFR